MLTRRTALAGIGAGLMLPGRATRAGAAEAPIVVPIGLTEGRVLVAVGVDGKGPYLFMIDTGGTVSLIDRALATELALPALSSRELRGAGGPERSVLYRVAELSIGAAVRERDLAFDGIAALDLGKDVRGTLAAGAVTAYSSVLDFDRNEWRIFLDGLGDLPGFTPIDSRIDRPTADGHGSAYIFATVTLDGQAFECLLDTGAPGALTLYPDAARRTSFWNDPTVAYAPVRRSGIGGEGAVSRVVRARELAIGPVRFEAPLVTLDGGARGQRVADGIVGLALLRQLNLATDTHRRRLLIERNQVIAPPVRAPTSGMWVDEKGGRLIVADVGRGGPAAAAGILPGDVIVGASLQKLLHALRSGPGANVTLTVEHDGQPRRVTITLANYI